MSDQEIIAWLLEGDISIRYQVYRDLLGKERSDLRARIASEGWGKEFLSRRNPDGHWGMGFYQPKWTSTHYTLLDLKNLGISTDCPPILETLDRCMRTQKGEDGGINAHRSPHYHSDVCVTGMALNYYCYFRWPGKDLESLIDMLMRQQMPDGGFNCRSNRGKPRHSALNSTLCVLEGLMEYDRNGYRYRLEEIRKVAAESREFLLLHRLFLSDRTGEIIDPKFLVFSWPGRWRYDILRAMDYFQEGGVDQDERMKDALERIKKKRSTDGRWKMQARHAGAQHFIMEQGGMESRINTLRALRILKKYGP